MENCRLGRNYEAIIAHLRAHVRARCPKPSIVTSSQWLQRVVHARLDECWSPEQISLRRRSPDRLPAMPARRRPTRLCIDRGTGSLGL
jgi:IS30 family transposase